MCEDQELCVPWGQKEQSGCADAAEINSQSQSGTARSQDPGCCVICEDPVQAEANYGALTVPSPERVSVFSECWGQSSV